MKKLILIFPFVAACGAKDNQDKRSSEAAAPATSTSPNSDSGNATPKSVKFTDDCLATAPVTKDSFLTAYDRVDINSPETLLSAKVEEKLLGVLTGKSGVEVTFSYANGPEQKKVTDDDGFARLPSVRTNSGAAPFCYSVKAGESINYGRTFYWGAEPVIVVMVDETLTNLSALKFSMKDPETIAPRPSAARVLNRLAEQYRIVYISILDDSSLSQLRAWMKSNQFPIGPTIVWDWNLSNTMGTSYNEQLRFKREFISDMKKKYPNIKAGIGSREEDAEAFQDQGIRTMMIANDVTDLPPTATIYSDWDAIDKGI